MKNILYPLLALAFLGNALKTNSAEIIAVDPVRILPSVIEQAQSSGQRLHLERFQESLERTCQEELKRSGRYKVVARRDLQKLLNDMKLGSSGLFKPSGSGVGNFTANTKLLILSINQFSFAKVEKKFEGLGRQVSRIEIPYSVSSTIYDLGTAENKYSFAKEGTHEKSITTPLNFPTQDQKLNAEVVVLSRIVSKAIATNVSENEFPPKVIAASGNLITINRGSLHNVKVGDNYKVFGVGEELIDPDTGEKLGSEQIPIGSIEITVVEQKWSAAKAIENFGIEKGAICRKHAGVTKASPGLRGNIGDTGTTGSSGLPPLPPPPPTTTKGSDVNPPNVERLGVQVKEEKPIRKPELKASSSSVLLVVEKQNTEIDVHPFVGLATSELNNNGYNVKSATDVIFNLSDSSSSSPKYTNAQLMEFSNCSFALIIGKITLNTAKQTINRPDLDLIQEIVTTTMSLPYRLIRSTGDSIFSGVEKQIYKDFGNDPVLSISGAKYQASLSTIFSSAGEKISGFLVSDKNTVVAKTPLSSKFLISLNPHIMQFPEVIFSGTDGQSTVKNSNTTFMPKGINVVIDGVLVGSVFDALRNLYEIEGSAGFKYIEITAPGYKKFERHVKIKNGITFTIPIEPTAEFKKELSEYARNIEEMKLRSKLTQAEIDKLIGESKFLENSKIVIEGAPPAKEVVIPGFVLPR
jgi:hypothetical protein